MCANGDSLDKLRGSIIFICADVPLHSRARAHGVASFSVWYFRVVLNAAVYASLPPSTVASLIQHQPFPNRRQFVLNGMGEWGSDWGMRREGRGLEDFYRRPELRAGFVLFS